MLNVYLLGKPHCMVLGNVNLLIVYSVLLLMGCKQPSYKLSEASQLAFVLVRMFSYTNFH